ncbi:hypothetical protein C1646_764842 [Rhizophagus diaphanus]|nr:hypothetical protein C1646_764842 [Rhizophagus diaphanus] [Rhizophagus sp. MUCL 43196]
MPYTSGSGRHCDCAVPALLSCHMTDTLASLIKNFLKFLKNAIIKEKKITPKSTTTTNDKIANPDKTVYSRQLHTKPTTPAITLALDPPDTPRPNLEPGSNKWYAELRRLRDDHNLQVDTQRCIEEEERKALLLGTSVKRADLREAMAQDLTTYQNTHHDRMTSYYKKRNKITDPAKLAEFDSQYKTFKLDYFSRSNLLSILP